MAVNIRSYNYDICFISFSDPFYDARTLNMVRLMARSGKNICLIAYGDETDVRNMKGYSIKLYPATKMKNSKASVRWTKFKIETKKYFDEINAKNYFACDVYSLPIARELKKMNSIIGAKPRLIYDSREIYSKLGPLEGQGLKQTVLTQAEKIYVSDVDYMVTTGFKDSEYLKEHFKHHKPYYEIYNFPPFRNHTKSNILRQKLNIPDENLLLIYQGMILKGRGIIPTIDAVEKMENVNFVIIGQGEAYSEIKAYVDSKNLNNKVHFTGVVPYVRLHELTCSADVGMCLFEPISKSYELAMPNKLFEYIIANIPMLVTDLPQMGPIIENDKVGLAVDPKCDIDEIVEKLESLRLYQDRLKYIEACKKSSSKFGYETQKDKILSLFQ